MSRMSIPEHAAAVWAKRQELEQTCTRLRHLDGGWTLHAMSADEAVEIAHQGLQSAYKMLDAFNRLALEEIKRLEAAAPRDET